MATNTRHSDAAGWTSSTASLEEVLLHVSYGLAVIGNGALVVSQLFLALVKLLGQLQILLLLLA